MLTVIEPLVWRDEQLTTSNLDGLLLPKVNTAEDVLAVSRFIDEHGSTEQKERLRMIASIESPLGLLNMREIATASEKVGGLLVRLSSAPQPVSRPGGQ